MHATHRQIVTIAVLGLVLTCTPSKGALTIVSGLATAGADFTSGPSQSAPPTGPISPDAFFASKNVVSTPSDPSGLTAEGWATCTWQIGATTLSAAGSSGQGYNGALGANGWIYGLGHASFSAGFELDQTCMYTAASPASNMKGLPGRYGFLPAFDQSNNKIPYVVSGYTYGNSGGFSVNVSFSPATAAQSSLLKGAISAPQIIPSSIPNHPYFIKISFIPQDGETIESAAETLGVSSLNFVNTIIAVPPSWQIIDNGQVVVDGNGQFPTAGLPDPLPQAASGSGRYYAAPALGMPPQQVKYAVGEGDQTSGAYYDVSFATSSTANMARPSATELDFVDSPHKPPGYFAQGGYQAFSTQLVGLDQNGNIIAYFGSPVYWYTYQTTQGTTVLGDSTLPDDPDIGTNFGGATMIGPLPLVINWTNPAPIPYGTALSSNQLHATANVQGWFAYFPTNGSLLSLGTNTLSTVFTPYDSVEYSPVTNAVSIIVVPAALTVMASNASRAFGQTNPIFTGTISGLTNRDVIGATFSCSATMNSPNGAYPIVTSLVDPYNRATNYSVTFVNGTLTVAPQPTNLVTNPGFEQMRSGWTFVGDSGVTPAPHTGNSAAFVNIATGSVSQAIATIPGGSYSINFWLAANGYSAPGAVITATFGGVVGFSNTYPAGAFGYQLETFTALATSTNSVFTFAGVMSGGTFFLDDVSIIALPTPTNGIVISSQPASDSVFIGGSGSFQVGVQGTPLLAYRWFFNQTNPIPNATNFYLALEPVSQINAGYYDVVITSGSGSVTSALATLSVLGVPVCFGTAAGSIQFSNGVFRTPILGLTGQGAVVVDVSADLSQWIPIYTNQSAFGSFEFSDTNAGNYSSQFYRARVVSPQP